MAAGPTERVADLLLAAKYKRMPLPLQVAGLDFDVAGAFVAVGHFADLVVIGDMAAQGERKVLQQVEGIARALDVMRSRRPLTTIAVGPRPVGKTLEALAQVGRILSVEEATDPAELRDQLAVLLPLKLPATLSTDRDLGAGEALDLSNHPLAIQLLETSKRGEVAVRDEFHEALSAVFAETEAEGDDDGEAEE